MKKKGFTLIEVIITMGIISMVMLMFSTLITSFLGVQNRMVSQSKVNDRLEDVVAIIKRDVKISKKNSNLDFEPIGVFDKKNNLITDGSAGEKVIIKISDTNGNSKYIQYSIEKDKLKVKKININNFNSTLKGGSTILSDIEEGEFRYKDKILLFYFKIKIPKNLEGKIKNKIRGVAIKKPSDEN